ncbi:molybdopterin molybdotransferase MoeA [Salaquimonas pukyongi]|uniref:molybdopterin molybdotransferase MoeA n=1 Tax=Salaquimonas pukyongi TaxID=2712698 RepID=UPI001FCD0925|nr:gephyrin-like molybdotransferase Glp [Salaquimonas pukyongi]
MADNNNILHQGLVPAQKALQLVLEGAAARDFEPVLLKETNGRVLARDLAANRTQPPFPASAMDGYAVRHTDLSPSKTVLEIIGEAAAGHPFAGELTPGTAVRIFTGAPVPDGADTIIIQENTTRNGDRVEVLQPADKGKFVRPAGLDFAQGDVLLKAGTVIDAQSLSLAAAMNHAELPVWKKPVVAVLATGDELVLPGEQLGEGQILASNTFGIAAIARQAGGSVIDLGIARDTLDDLTARIGKALDNGADLIVTTGGASVGDHDLVKPAMEHFGFTFSFVKIAMRPGKPVMFGKARIGGKERRFLGLAGNPVSSLVSGHIFMRPLIRLLGGYDAATVMPVSGKLEVAMGQNDEREDYIRATARRNADGKLLVAPFPKQDSSMLATLSKADCLIIRPVHAPPAAVGDGVPVILLRNV